MTAEQEELWHERGFETPPRPSGVELPEHAANLKIHSFRHTCQFEGLPVPSGRKRCGPRHPALAAGVSVFQLARIMATSVAMIERSYGTLIEGAGADICPSPRDVRGHASRHGRGAHGGGLMACAVTASTRGDSRNTPRRGYGWVGGSPAWWTDGAWCERITPDSPSEIFKAVGAPLPLRAGAVRACRQRPRCTGATMASGQHALRSKTPAVRRLTATASARRADAFGS